MPELSFYNPLDKSKPRRWPRHTLVMPVCAVGNVGQLAIDLLISTLMNDNNCKLVGRIYSPAIMTVVGPNAFTLDGPPSTTTEVYECSSKKMVLIQQRSSYYKAYKQNYISNLINWIKESEFERVLVLTSSFSSCIPRESCDIETQNLLRAYTTASFKPDSGWIEASITTLPNSTSDRAIKDGMTFLPGSGLTKPLIKALGKNQIPAASIISFCSEGENLNECYSLMDKLKCVLNLEVTSWLEPFSWNQIRDSDYAKYC